MRPAARLTVLTALAASLACAPTASARVYDVPASLGGELTRVAERSAIPVRVPARLDLDFDGTVHAAGQGGRRSWELDMAGAPDCGGATACFLAQFSGERGGTPAFRRKVRLTGGRTGWYKPLSCGASCSPPMIQWRQGAVLYSIQANVAGTSARAHRRAMIAAANSAIRARPR